MVRGGEKLNRNCGSFRMELLPRCGDIMKSDFYFRKMERNRGGGFHFFFLIFIPARSDYISLFNRNEYYAVEG